MNKHLIIVVLLCVHVFVLQAQNVSGIWKGTLTMPNGCFPVNNIELQINLFGDSIQGGSYHYLDVDNYIKKGLTGRYNSSSKILTLQEGAVTTYHIPARCIICFKHMELKYSREGNVEYLKGGWTGKIGDSDTACGPGTFLLSRARESAFKEVPEVSVDTGVIRLDFYDNGEIDGDSISVLVNKKLILSHHRLTAKPATAFIRIDEANTFQEIEMIAENLGSIPPNTALLIISAGEKRYRLFLTSTEIKSAKVRFVYEKSVAKAVDPEPIQP